MQNKNRFLLIIPFILAACSKGGGGGENPPPGNTPSKIYIEDVSLFEGNGGTNTFNVRVQLDKASASAVSVTYSTSNGWAKSGEDYTAAVNQVVTFAAGETSKNITIGIVADDIKEGDDDFTITLSSPSGGTIQKGTGKVVIRNDDTRVDFTNTGYDAPASYPGYVLVWADEFNTGSLDATAWTVEEGNGCPSICGWGNNELEYYTGRSGNLFFQDGKMIIEAKQEVIGSSNYTSSKIVSRGKKTFKYGRIDIRAKLPIGKGIWPAFWMLPQENKYGGWPTSGEIDIMEMVGHEGNRTHGTLHFGPGPGSTQYNRHTTLSSGNLTDQFHVYSVEWKEDQITWFLDGVQFSQANKADLNLGGAPYPFNEDFFFIINLAVGGNWPGNPDATTYFPQWLIVDYIRVYQQ
ncbi:MAG TPA: family 16 glycosylhydrolase [Chitinophagaceae bacterium]|nr:family 16 glycosylhydrolase [Chitinophagaceae bacterium]